MQLAHIHYDSQSILVVNKQGYLRLLHCPFGVVSIAQIGNVPPLTKMLVDEVKTTLQDVLVYIICGKNYYHKHFRIVIQL